MAMEGLLFEKLSVMGAEGALFIISMIPVVELKGSIILGAAFGLPWWDVFLVSVLGNMFPIPFILLLGRRLFDWMKRFRLFAKVVKKIEAKVQAQSGRARGRLLGLMAFVSIPIPGTGGWTGSILAALMGFRMKQALPAILCGIVISGTLMTLGAYGVVGAFQTFVS